MFYKMDIEREEEKLKLVPLLRKRIAELISGASLGRTAGWPAHALLLSSHSTLSFAH